MDMEPANLILGALTAGAVASVKDTTSQVIKDTYAGLKSLIQHKFANHLKAQAALHDYEDDPETYEKPLKKALTANQLDQDDEIITAARHLLSLVQPQQVGLGKYNIQNTGNVQGQVIGDDAHVMQHFGNHSEE